MTQQAERASRAQIDLHISRQHALGERMIGDHDKPKARELVASMLILAVAIGVTWYAQVGA
ncbi:hypothetical protein D3C76_47820 [compost metagenome]